MGILVTVGSLCCAILYFRFPKIPMAVFLVSLTTLRYESVDVIVIPVVEPCVGGVEGRSNRKRTYYGGALKCGRV